MKLSITKTVSLAVWASHSRLATVASQVTGAWDILVVGVIRCEVLRDQAAQAGLAPAGTAG